MATVPMKKIGIIGYKADSTEILKTLQREGAVHITPIGESKEESFDIEDKIRRIDSAANFLVEFLEKPPKRPTLSPQEALAIVENFKYEPIIDKIEKMRTKRDELNTKIGQNKASINMLKPWETLSTPLSAIHDTVHCKVRMGTIPTNFIETFESEVIEQPLLFWKEIKRCREGLYIIIIFHNSISEWTDELLSKVEFTHWEPKHFMKTPAEEISSLEAEIATMRSELAKISDEAKELSKHIISLWAIGDHYEQVLESYRVLAESTHTQKTFAMQGWVPAKLFLKLKKHMETAFDSVEVMELPTLPEDDPPVALKNPFFVEAFQVITDLYGRPRKGMVDPTPYVAPFFAIYFALCLTDAGYGLMLTIIAAIGLIMMKQPSTRRFLRLILYVGILTIGAGIITGGYFGIKLPDPAQATGLAAFALKLKLFDPLDNIMEFFDLSIALGIIQLSIGFLVAGYVHLKESKKFMGKLHSIVIALSWVAVTFGVGLFVMGYILPDKLGYLEHTGVQILEIGAVSVVLGHLILGPLAGKGIGESIGNAFGFDGLYGIIGVFSDLLSFVRLTALGLSTAIVAGVITQMGTQMRGFMLVLGILILLGGHIFYCLFSSLGAFVHPTRLQFVEFFSKFYESGGKPFEPFRRKYKRIEVI